eukprot:12305500-Alexandrium_andersonii.AAC.1
MGSHTVRPTRGKAAQADCKHMRTSAWTARARARESLRADTHECTGKWDITRLDARRHPYEHTSMPTLLLVRWSVPTAPGKAQSSTALFTSAFRS